MRFHVSGVGAIGTLLSFHLKRTSRRLIEEPNSIKSLPHTSSIPYLPSPFNLGIILRLRKQGIAKHISRKLQNSVTVERNHARERESGFGAIYKGLNDQIGGVFGGSNSSSQVRSPDDESLPGSSRLEELGYPKGSIDALIVTTKAHTTLSALRPLVPHITSATTIVLLQNGQGVLDLLLEKLFTDPAKRPHFILASTTHGAFTINKLHCVHAANGRIDIGIVPNQTLGKDYERLLEQSTTSIEEAKEGEGENMQGISSPSTIYSRLLPPQKKQRPKEERRNHLQGPPLLDISAIPSMPSTQTLLYTMSTLLNLPLSVTWHPIRNFQMLSLKKLVVNACINPVTALVECRNGDLFGNKYASNTIRDLCSEISLILETLAQRAHIRQDQRLRAEQQLLLEDDESLSLDWEALSKSDYLLAPSNTMGNDAQSGVPALDASLRAGALFREVQRVAQLTAPNYSSMLQDIQSKAPATEINFINGYFSRLGKSLGIATPVNDLMVNLIQLKTTRTSSPWTSKM
jgi:2-dehydropantoate 2-reductase